MTSKFSNNKTNLNNYKHLKYYLITLKIKHKQCLLGNVKNKIMSPSKIGLIACESWNQIHENFLNICLDGFMIMPNYINGIVILNKTEKDYDLILKTVKLFKRQFSSRVRKYFSNYEDIWGNFFFIDIINNEKSLKDIRKSIIESPQNWRK